MSIDSVANMNGRDTPKTPGNRIFLRAMRDFPSRPSPSRFTLIPASSKRRTSLNSGLPRRREGREGIESPNDEWPQGITFVELLVMIGIVVVLAIVIAGIAIHLRRSAQTTGQKANFAAIESALTAYYQDFGDYPRNSILPKWNTRQNGPAGAPTPAPLFYSLATALLGPGPAVTQTIRGELQMGDGNDGPGFRSQSVTVFSGNGRSPMRAMRWQR